MRQPHTRRAAAVLAVLTAAVVLVVPAACSRDDGLDGGGGKPAPTSGTSPGGTAPSGTTTGATAALPTPLGAKWDWGRFPQFTPFLKTMSGGFTYYEVVWCDIEKEQGRPDWSALDRIASRSREVGVNLLLKLRVGRCWATSGDAKHERGSKAKTESAMPVDLGAYRAWVRSTVTRYSKEGVHEYAIENEINSEGFWDGTPAEFTTLAEAAATEIRQGDPAAKVVDAGLSSTTYGYGIADWLLKQGRESDALAAYNAYFERRFGTRGDQLTRVTTRAQLEAALSSDQGRRNLAYLALMQELARRKVTDIRQIHFYEKYSSVPMLFSFLRANTPAGTPIQAWEVGSFDKSAATGDDASKSQEVLKTVTLMLAEGAQVVIWLPLAFDPQGRNSDEPRYGLLEPDGQVRQAGRVFQALVEASRGARVVKVAQDGLTGVGLDRGSTSTAFVWSDAGAVVQLSGGGTAAPVENLDQVASRPTVSIGSDPQRLSLKSPTATFLKEQR